MHLMHRNERRHLQEAAAELSARAERQRNLIASHLWDEENRIFTNAFWNGTFYERISPTSFYALMAGAATDAQAPLTCC